MIYLIGIIGVMAALFIIAMASKQTTKTKDEPAEPTSPQPQQPTNTPLGYEHPPQSEDNGLGILKAGATIAIIMGIISVIGGIYMATSTENWLPFVAGIIGLGSMILLAGLCKAVAYLVEAASHYMHTRR